MEIAACLFFFNFFFFFFFSPLFFRLAFPAEVSWEALAGYEVAEDTPVQERRRRMEGQEGEPGKRECHGPCRNGSTRRATQL